MDTDEPEGRPPSGDETLVARGALSRPIRFYASWRCPYSQRVWIGLEEKAVDYQWVEVELLAGSQAAVGSGDDERGSRRRPLSSEQLRQRHPELFEISPRGELPALDDRGGHAYGNRVLLEYVHEAFDGAPLLPKTPALRARARLWAAHVDERIVPHYERLLASRDDSERLAARRLLLQGLEEFSQAMAPLAEGPFLLGDDFSIADIALAPWWQRMVSVLRAYRKFDPSLTPRLQIWYEAVRERPAFQRTHVDPERLIQDAADFAELAGGPRAPLRSSEPGQATAKLRRAPRGARQRRPPTVPEL